MRRRKFPSRPIVGVGAAIIRRDAVLLVQRRTPPRQGQWSLPGGVVEVGETLDEALRREIKEETQLEIRIGPLLKLFERIDRDDQGRVLYHYIIADYFATVRGGRLKASSDVCDARFVRRSQLQKYPLTNLACEVIARAFKTSRA